MSALLDLLSDMRRQGVEPIKLLCSHQRLREGSHKRAIRLLFDMRRQGVEPRELYSH